MKVHIDKTKCTLCATCVGICPEVFEMKEDGSVDIKDEFKDKDIPKELEARVKEAEGMCPSSAVIVEE